MKMIFTKAKINLIKYSPEILMTAGIVGAVASAVMACKATTKIGNVLGESKERLDTIKESFNDETLEDKKSQEDANKDLALVYVQTGIKLTKLYAPSIILGGLSLGGILASNDILRKRNVALAAAYATIDAGFKDYRNRVVQRFGDEVEKEIFYGLEKVKAEITEEDEEGKKKKRKEDILVVDESIKNPFTFFFDSDNPYWEKNGDYNRMFLLAQQQYANNKLRSDKILFLNDVLAAIGIPKTKEGQVLGWICDPKNKDIDNFVDFGMTEAFKRDEIIDDKMKAMGEYINPSTAERYERTVMLNFNVDGNVWEKMK